MLARYCILDEVVSGMLSLLLGMAMLCEKTVVICHSQGFCYSFFVSSILFWMNRLQKPSALLQTRTNGRCKWPVARDE